MKLYDRIRNGIPETMNLPDHTLPGVPIVELYGNRRVLIEGHCAVTQYTDNCITVKTSCGAVAISGHNLHLAVLTKEQLVIVGSICDIHLCGR